MTIPALDVFATSQAWISAYTPLPIASSPTDSIDHIVALKSIDFSFHLSIKHALVCYSFKTSQRTVALSWPYM
jgi:hypothetical protein